MGTKWEVSAYVKYQTMITEDGKGYAYRYVSVCMTNSLYQAIKAMIKAKGDGAGCVKLEWRG
jgi:hypothetical protein